MNSIETDLYETELVQHIHCNENRLKQLHATSTNTDQRKHNFQL